MDFLVKPWEHQKKAIAQSFTWRDMALLWEMGTGKTGATINILRGRFSTSGRLLRTLIFAPPIVLKNWQREFGYHSKIPQHQIVVLRGTGAKRVKQLKDAIYNPQSETWDKSIILLMNYEAISNKEILKHLEWWAPEVVVCDESHNCKDFKSKRANLVLKLTDKSKHNYILTGTPILNTSMDLFMQYRILDRGETFGKNFYAFRGQYFEDDNATWAASGKPGYFPKWVPKPTTYDEFQQKIYKKGLRATKEECLDLPPLIKTIRHVEMNDEQKRMYKEMKDEFITFIKAKHDAGEPRAVIAQLAITKALRLQQIVTGFAKDEEGVVHTLENVPRVQTLKELLEELSPAHKILVWSVFTENYGQIRQLCEHLKIGYAELHGGCTLKEKEKSIDRLAKDQDCRVIIGHPRAGGVGANLTASSYSIYYSRNFSLADSLQSESRNHRGGSEIHEKITHIDLVCPGTMDELVAEALRQKKNIGDSILEWKDY